jgi:hypothetical protein
VYSPSLLLLSLFYPSACLYTPSFISSELLAIGRVVAGLSELCETPKIGVLIDQDDAMSTNWQPQIPVEERQGGPIEGGPDGVKGSGNEPHGGEKKKIVVVGLGMVGISFM